MNIGTLMGIQVNGVEAQLTTELVGMEEGEYVILKMPPLYELGLTANILYRGNGISVKYRHKGTIFGFSSRILGFITNPAHLIFIDYPTRFENFGLRSNKRISCHLPAQVKISGNLIEGSITDISKKGCHFIADLSKIAHCITSIETVGEFTILFKLPGMKNELTIPSIQKNISTNTEDIGLGIEFIHMDIDTKAILSGFLLKAEESLSAPGD
ncbi:MAG: flagellar brake protein [Candidatus Scalindua sp.]|nr:flagellar brake protein [Candidatus Scalindua sp.]